MPRQSLSQIIGREGEKWFEAQLPPSWIPQRPTEDIGVDALVVICEDNALNGLEFRVQIKSASTWRVRNENILLPFSRLSLVDLIKGLTPALLVTYEASSKRGYCFWLNQIVARDLSLLRPHRKSVTLAIPMTRPITRELWPRLGQEVRGLSSAIGSRVAVAGRSFPILAFVHAMSQALKDFDFVAYNWATGEVKSDEQAAVLHALEVSSHRDVVRAMMNLQASLPPELNPIVGVGDLAQDWMGRCESLIPGFRNVVHDENPDLWKSLMAVKLDHKLMSEKRPGFVRTILEAQVQITKLGVGHRDTKTDGGDHASCSQGDWLVLPSIKVDSQKERMSLARITVANLGFPEGATTREIIGSENDVDVLGHSAPFTAGCGSRLGLELCPSMAAPNLRLEYTDQPANERLFVAMKPIADSEGVPRIFVVEHTPRGKSLDAVRARPEDRWLATDAFVFCTGRQSLIA